MTKVEQMAEQLDQLTLLEAAQLSKLLQEKWGVSAATPMAVGAMARMAGGARGGGAGGRKGGRRGGRGGGGGRGEKRDRREGAGGAEVRGLALRGARAVVDEAPKRVKEKVSRAEAEDMKKKLEEVGATVEIK